MKKLLVLLLLMQSIGTTKANPIPVPPVISEFYMVNDSTWYLELVFPQSPYFGSNFDGFRLESSGGSCLFKNGITITADSIIIITQDSLQSLLHFNRSGDYIAIKNESDYLIEEIYFGNISNSMIAAPLIGQSLVRMAYSCYSVSYGFETDYYLVKDNNPTIGYDPFQVSSAKGIFTGKVFDLAHNPVPGIKVGNIYYITGPGPSVCENFYKYFITDSTGSFSSEEFSSQRTVDVFASFSTDLLDTLITIEPDSINYYEFTIDTLLTGIESNSFQGAVSLSCYPNPSTGETYFTFAMKSNKHYSKALIKIYDPNGEIVRMLPVNISDKQDTYTVKWDGICYYNAAASGMYYCKLELDGKEAATQKIIIAK